MQSANDELMALKHNLEQQIGDCNRTIERYETEVAQHQAKVVQLESSLKQCNSHIEDLEQQITITKSNLSETQTTLQKTTTELVHANDSNHALRQKHDACFA